MKPWEHPDAADQIPNPDGDDEGVNDAQKVYDKGVRKAMEVVIIACEAGATTSQIRDAAQSMLDKLDRLEES